MKSVAYFGFLILIEALISSGSCYLYSSEDPYSEFLSKHSEFAGNHISGFNLKITDEALNSLTNKLQNELDKDGEGENTLFSDPKDDSNEFDHVDLTEWDTIGNIPEDSEHMELSDVKLNTKFCKREFGYSKVFTTSGKGNKSFMKLYQSSREGGQITSAIHGSLNTTLTSSSSGNADSSVNTTAWVKGKDYHTTVAVTSTLETSATEKKMGKQGDKLVSSSNMDVSSTFGAGNKTFNVKTNVKTNAETFRAPFRVYLTLFDSTLSVSGIVTEGGEIKGEVTSRVVFSKNGKSLTKSKIRGYVVYEMEKPSKACGISMFKSKSHTWTKVVKSNETNGEVVVEVYTSTKTRVYGKASAAEAKVFSGSGLVTFQKAEVVIPSLSGGIEGGKVHEHEYGVNIIAKHHLGDYVSSVRHITSKIMSI